MRSASFGPVNAGQAQDAVHPAGPAAGPADGDVEEVGSSGQPHGEPVGADVRISLEIGDRLRPPAVGRDPVDGRNVVGGEQDRPSSPHEPPLPLSALQMVTTGPPAISTRSRLPPSVKKARERLSGDQKW